MKKGEFYAFLLLVLLTVFLISLVWEFWLEDLAGPLLYEAHAPESPDERWEYVISMVIFVSLSLIYPTLVGRRLIAAQQRLNEKLKEVAEHDYLTGLLNRRKLSDLLQTEVARCRRYGSDLAIILLDIDFFKQTNDRLGHAAGDRLLVAVAKLLKETGRSCDVVGRWGGEEFLVICPETTLGGATVLAEKLRSSIDRVRFAEAGHKTASFGVAGFLPQDTVQTLIYRADQAMYAAKQSGRNRVETAARRGTSPPA